MLTLPPTLAHPVHAEPTTLEQEPLHYIEPSLPTRSNPFPLILILAAVTLLLIAFAWLLVH